MTLHRSEKEFFELLKRNKPKVGTLPDLKNIRIATTALFAEHQKQAADIPYKDVYVPVRDAQKIRVRIFNPENTGMTLFFLSGNAFLFDLFESNSAAASRIAKFGNFKVITIDFRLMPENPWPTSINDIEDVITFMHNYPKLYAINPDFLYLAAICSGALAAALIFSQERAPFKIQKLILMNGLYEQSFSQKGYEKFEQKDVMIDRLACVWWLQHYNISLDEARSPDYSPLNARNFSHLPDVELIVSEYDGFRSDTEALYLKLKAYGTSVSKTVIPGKTHNTMLLRASMTDGQDPAEIIAQSALSHFHAR
jgi:acetyl esterase